MKSRSLAIDLRDVHVSVPGASLLQAITWQIPVGHRAVILGPNGCGKSTLLRAITAYGHVTKGTVTVLGEKLGETHVHELRKRLGIVDSSLSRLLDEEITAAELVATGLFGHLTTYFDRPSDQQLEKARETLADVGLGNHGDQLVATLSAGQLRRTWVARALVSDPEILILDEPTAELDLLARETMLASLAKLAEARPELTILMVTHHLEDLLPNTDELLLLSRGRSIACGPPAEVLTCERISQAFGCPVDVTHRDGRWHWAVAQRDWAGLLDRDSRRA